jgi:enoyl-CoA hydratase
VDIVMRVLLFEKRGRAAWLTLNRPEQNNLLNGELFVALADAWDEVRSDPDIRVAVLTASGPRDFCCGGDLADVIPLWTGSREPQNELEQRLLADPMIVDRVMLKAEPMHKPVIAAINGRALGGGTELLQATDIRIAADSATFALPEPQSGIVPGAGSMVRLARQLPYAHAMKILLGGEPVDAAQAQAMGLVSEVVPQSELLSRAEEVSARVCAQAPLALQAIKKTVLETHTQEWAEAFRFEMEQAASVMMSRDAREGPRAFRDKRTPDFRGE